MFGELWEALGRVGDSLLNLAGATRRHEVRTEDVAREERIGGIDLKAATTFATTQDRRAEKINRL